LFVLSVLCLSLTGCASQGTVSGKITCGGEPLKGGFVTFIPDESGPNYTTSINEDGTYSIANVKVGKYKVCVDTEGLKGGGGPAGPSTGPAGGGSYKGSGPPPSAKMPGGSAVTGGADLQKKAESGKLKAGPPPGATLPEGYRDGFTTQKENAAKYVPIPTKYAKPETTDLTVEVKGSQQFDIPLQK